VIPIALNRVIGTPKNTHVATVATILRRQPRDECCKTVSLLRMYVDAKLWWNTIYRERESELQTQIHIHWKIM
jgi:hypothetical protein